jgi:hypothetical protein
MSEQLKIVPKETLELPLKRVTVPPRARSEDRQKEKGYGYIGLTRKEFYMLLAAGVLGGMDVYDLAALQVKISKGKGIHIHAKNIEGHPKGEPVNGIKVYPKKIELTEDGFSVTKAVRGDIQTEVNVELEQKAA